MPNSGIYAGREVSVSVWNRLGGSLSLIEGVVNRSVPQTLLRT